jgi:hypothetical protein
MDPKRKLEARRNLQRLLEAYLREESAMRWGATNAQIRAAAKQMVRGRQIPAPVVERIKERLNAIRQSSASAVL